MRWCGSNIARLTLLLVLLLVGWTAPVYAGPTSSPTNPEETVLIVEVGSGAVVVVRATSSRSAWSIQYAYCDGDPVNREDPTGLYWQLARTRHSREWQWVDEGPDRPKYPLAAVPGSLVQAAHDMLDLAGDNPAAHVNVRQDVAGWLEPNFALPHVTTIHSVNGNPRDLNIFSQDVPGTWPIWDSWTGGQQLLWLRSLNNGMRPMVEPIAKRYNVPAQTIISAIAGEIIDSGWMGIEGAIEGNIVTRKAANAIGQGYSIGPAQLRVDSIRGLGLWPELSDLEVEDRLMSFEGSITVVAHIQRAVLDHIRNGQGKVSGGGIGKWVGAQTATELEGLSSARGLWNKRVGAGVAAVFALNQNNITSPSTGKVGYLSDLAEIINDGTTFEQGANQHLMMGGVGAVGIYDNAPTSWLWDPNTIRTFRAADAWLNSLPPENPADLLKILGVEGGAGKGGNPW